MRLFFSIACLIATVVFAYCYFYSNKSIKDGRRFWRSLTVMFACLTTNFAFRHYAFDNIYLHSGIFIVFGFYLHDILRTSLLNIRSQWSTVKNEEEIKIEVETAVNEERDYVQQAMSELPDMHFSQEFRDKVKNRLTKEL